MNRDDVMRSYYVPIHAVFVLYAQTSVLPMRLRRSDAGDHDQRYTRHSRREPWGYTTLPLLV